ncbi:MAG: hypothetical protein IJ960_00840 [Oscillospiraceae bacterium]|nr:hypothetical protein [Oscillospiraceae bacterium]
MAKERRKIIVAGNMWMAVQYTAIHTQNQAARREAKAHISTPAREALNASKSWEKMMLVLAANFRSRDLVVTLTYKDGDLPPTREAADKRLDNFIRALRKYRRSKGQALVYCRATEGYHSGGRLHHHLILNATGDDYEIIRQLWAKNGDNIDFEPFGHEGAERWAKYLTKEPRVQGRRYVGDRTWRTSRNVKKPVTSYCFVPETDELEAPPGAHICRKLEDQNSYGRFKWMVALLPERDNCIPLKSDLG